MIVTRTPFRVTLGGGGTDLPSYYRHHGGFIFAMGLDKYMYVATNRPVVGPKLVLHYAQSEAVEHVGQLRHPLAREALRKHGIENNFEVSSMADLPAGTGLGSSSCYMVGLLNALHHYRRDYVSLQTLAEEACHIELEILKEGIGKQDQYMAAYGGLTVLEIAPGGAVKVRQLRPSSGDVADFVAHTHIYYTGAQRDAREVLADQNVAMQSKESVDHARVAESLHRIKELGYHILEAIETGNYDRWGQLLDQHWQNKKKLSKKISLSAVDQIYDEVRARFGVLGGKIIGAGGGGFLMLYCPGQPAALGRFMAENGMPRMHYTVEPEGTKVITQIGQGFLPGEPLPASAPGGGPAPAVGPAGAK
jgi:D-glycero-alpha-D-manno-heptose-7-phosphate kinase